MVNICVTLRSLPPTIVNLFELSSRPMVKLFSFPSKIIFASSAPPSPTVKVGVVPLSNIPPLAVTAPVT